METKEIFCDEYKKQYIDLMTYCFKSVKEDDITTLWSEFDKSKGTLLGNLDNGKIAASILIYNYTINLNGNKVKMGGIGNVSTYPTYRVKGACADLLKKGLKIMNENDMVISFLGPFKYEFYEKFGWKWSLNLYNYEFDIKLLKDFKLKGDFKIATKEDYKLLDTLYENGTQDINGVVKRNEYLWEKRLTKADSFIAIYYDEAKAAKGYLNYFISNDSKYFHVNEIIYNDFNTLENLLAYIYIHNAQTPRVSITDRNETNILDILPSPRVEAKYISDMMVRIVNVQKALKVYNFVKDGEFSLKVDDPQCEWNNKTFKVIINNKKANQIEAVDSLTPDIALNIKELTQLIMGFRTLEDLANQNKVKLNSQDIIQFFTNKRHKAGIYDYF